MLYWLLALAAQGQGDNPCAGAGAEAACRQVDSIRLESASGQSQTIGVNTRLPWVVQDNVLLTPGESVTIRLERRGADLVPHLVRGAAGEGAPEPGENEVRFILSDVLGGNVTLTVLSRFTEVLDYAALINVYGRGPERTSVCALMPGVTVFEQWSVPIGQMALWSFRPTSQPTCRIVALPRPTS
jgi:hypothetical protein